MTTATPVHEVVARDVRTFSLAATDAKNPSVAVPGLGNVTSTNAFIGANNTVDRLVRITGLHLQTASPSTVIVTPRQGDNQNFGFPDQFVIMVITTAPDNILIRIRRIDANDGWGQNLRVDILIVDFVHNP